MTNLRISALPAASVASYDDLYPVSQDGTGPDTGYTRKITPTLLFSLLVEPPAIGTTTPNVGSFSTLTGGAGSANYVVMTGGAAAAYPLVTVTGSDTNIDWRIVPKGTGYLSSPKLFVGSTAVRAGLNTGAVVYLRSSTTLSGTTVPPFAVGGIYTGSATNNVFLHDFQATETLNATSGVTANHFLHTINAGSQGGRTNLAARLFVSGKPNSTTTQFLVSLAGIARATAPYNGSPGNHMGLLFGQNNIVTLQSGSAGEWGSVISAEFDTTMPLGTGAEFHIGVSSVLHWDNGVNHEVRGSISDNAFQVGSARNDRSTVGWRIGYAYGDSVGWTFNDDSQLIGMQPVTSAFAPFARAITLGDGLNLVGVTLKRAALITEDASIDFNGNIGGQTTGGVALQTRSEVNAKSASIVTGTTGIVPLQPDGGGMYYSSNIPTVLIDAPPAGYTGSSTATAVIATHAATYGLQSIGVEGTDYAVNDVLTMVGGTFTVAAQITITDVNSTGGVRSAYVSRAGNYTVLPASPATFSGGSGTGFTGMTNWTALTVNVTSGGAGYAEFPAPKAVYDFGVGASGRQPVFVVTMTATQEDLTLNPDGQVVFPAETLLEATGTTQGTAAAITTDYVVMNAGAAGTTGVILPPALKGKRKVVSGESTMIFTGSIYPDVGEHIFLNGTGDLGVNTPVPIDADQAFVFECTVDGRWYAYQISV